LSLEGVLADAENVEVFYLKETISFNKVQEGESVVWETAILYKFYVKLDKPCKLFIYLPFSLQGAIKWKQENMRRKEYQTEVAHATKFESVEDNIFRIKFYEELGEFTALLLPDEKMKDITVITSKQTRQGTSSKITIDISGLDFQEDFFQIKGCGFGFMFKVRTRDFLTKENMEKLSSFGQSWSFNIIMYPVLCSLTTEDRKRLINLHDADIWAILPKDATIFHLSPPARTVIMMEEKDEELENKYADIAGTYKTYRSGQIAICWDLRDVRREKILNYIGSSPLGVKRSEIGEVRKKMNEIDSSMKKLSSNFRHFKQRSITWDQLFAPLTLFLTFFALIMTLIFNIFFNLYQSETISFLKVKFSPIFLMLILLIATFIMFFYFARKMAEKSKS